LVKNLEISKVSLRKETPLIQVIDKPVYPLIKKRISALKGVVISAFAGMGLTILILALGKMYEKIMR
jgi:uncharacterized protein involved in exopolysaccharide biosynthesis